MIEARRAGAVVRAFVLAEMPVRAVPSRFMYRGLCSVPDILSYKTPVTLPEDEVEGKSNFSNSFFTLVANVESLLLLKGHSSHAKHEVFYFELTEQLKTEYFKAYSYKSLSKILD